MFFHGDRFTNKIIGINGPNGIIWILDYIYDANIGSINDHQPVMVTEGCEDPPIGIGLEVRQVDGSAILRQDEPFLGRRLGRNVEPDILVLFLVSTLYMNA